ncbi:hypothetical protein Ciccas_013608, partial [Cichlidogyrus casuarinus]
MKLLSLSARSNRFPSSSFDRDRRYVSMRTSNTLDPKSCSTPKSTHARASTLGLHHTRPLKLSSTLSASSTMPLSNGRALSPTSTSFDLTEE